MASMYERLGGNLTCVKDLAHEFYDVMDADASVSELRGIHPRKLHAAKKHLYRFLSHWLGGPKLLSKQYATAGWLELRHRHVQLTDENARQWLYCMDKAMTNQGVDAQLRKALHARFSALIAAMRHRREAVDTGP